MATVKEREVKGFCDTVFVEMTGIRQRILDMREKLIATYGAKNELFEKYDRHLGELADHIEWKLQILAKACPFDWKGSDKDVESVVSVNNAEKGPDISGGYLGG